MNGTRPRHIVVLFCSDALAVALGAEPVDQPAHHCRLMKQHMPDSVNISVREWLLDRMRDGGLEVPVEQYLPRLNHRIDIRSERFNPVIVFDHSEKVDHNLIQVLDQQLAQIILREEASAPLDETEEFQGKHPHRANPDAAQKSAG